MFQLTVEEFKNLKSQIATSRPGWGGRRTPPYVFTEFSALQAANVLKSEQAIKMSTYVVRAFIRLREMILSNVELSRKIDMLEKRIGGHDKILMGLVRESKGMIDAPKPKKHKRSIGFILPDNTKK